MHELKYLSLALDDLRNIIDYITDTLKAPKAALDLLNTLNESISRFERFPYSCKVYQPILVLEKEYRMLPVKNYLVFYVVTDTEVEIHRVIYAKMDLNKAFK